MKLIIQTILFFIVVISVLTMIFDHSPVAPVSDHSSSASFETKPVSPRRVSRFLQQKARNPNAADHCHKDAEICNYILEGRNTTCCNNKCIDLGYDHKNCGACKKKCDATESCCNGECVNLAFDKRHCSECNNKCSGKGYCIYGICDYA